MAPVHDPSEWRRIRSPGDYPLVSASPGSHFIVPSLKLVSKKPEVDQSMSTAKPQVSLSNSGIDNRFFAMMHNIVNALFVTG